MGQQGSIITFYFFVPNVLKIISRHKSFFKFRGRGGATGALGGTSSPPPLLNIKCVAADIMRGVANILHGGGHHFDT